MSHERPVTFEEAVLRLQAYWRERGCLIWQPINTEVGAGTMNPATFLRSLGPDPWRVAYVEPSVRPDDSRYGENPNRMQTHTQFQVLLKPDTGCPVEQYFGSLEALGIDTRANDVRLVEDNWASPALGAWGLGWEIWLNGLEITQFTYFQQAGGHMLDPVSVEITYGLERILMALQGRTHFKDIEYAEGVAYGELFGRAEREMSAYYLDEAEVERTRQLFAAHEAEAKHLLEEELVLPAYAQLLRLSHLFNILDARGAVGPAERAGFFGRIRTLARRCADLWLESESATGAEDALEPSQAPAPAAPEPSAPSTPTATLLIEVGVEEMPPGDVGLAMEALPDKVRDILQRARVEHGGLRVHASPRRLVVLVDDVPTQQPDLDRNLRGPRASVAWDEDGRPTKAGDGFARRHGLEASELERELADGDEFAVARVREPGRPTAAALAEELPLLLAKLVFPRNMRWNASGVAFSRPIRWIVTMLGEQVVPYEFAGVQSGRVTRGLRGDDAPLELASATIYEATLQGEKIDIDRDRRRETIWREANALAREAGGTIDDAYGAGLLDEVADLVESPQSLLGSFDERFLRLPHEVLATVMVKHQRYFPVSRDGVELLPRFVVVANGDISPDLVRAGNEVVIGARYADAEFFYAQDLRRPFGSFREDLGMLTFHERLGSVLDRADRIERLADSLSQRAELSDEQRQVTLRAAHLAKNDLATSMVIELPSLAGVVGRYYAAQAGEPAEVADAIRDHVRPTSASDDPPASLPGTIVALADRLDSLVGLFAAGVEPSGAADPYGLRRSAYGIIEILHHRDLDLDLREAVAVAAEQQPIEVGDEVLAAVLDFVWRRLEVRLREADNPQDVVRAAIAGGRPSVVAKMRTATELGDIVRSPRFGRAHTAWTRAANLASRAPADPVVEESLFAEPAEMELWRAYTAAEPDLREAATVAELIDAFDPLVDKIDQLFASVLVLAEDESVARNRLSLLALIAAAPSRLADFADLGPSLEGTARDSPEPLGGANPLGRAPGG